MSSRSGPWEDEASSDDMVVDNPTYHIRKNEYINIKRRLRVLEDSNYDLKDQLTKLVKKEMEDSTQRLSYLLDLRYIELFGKLEKAFPHLKPPPPPPVDLPDDCPYIS